MYRDTVITSWQQLQAELFKDSWNDEIQRFRSPFVFRGLSDANYRLETSLMRLAGPFAALEHHLLRNFRKYSQGSALHTTSVWHLLANAQHHGLPTRLMDWTYSPYIAAHFATADHEKMDRDAVIWVVDYQSGHRLLPSILRDRLDEEGAQAFTIELLSGLNSRDGNCDPEDISFHDVVQSLKAFDQLGAKEDFLLFFEPPSINERIINQFALFSIMSNPSRRVDEWLARHEHLCRRLIIPTALKWEVRDKLDQCNITERVLFPGLDGLSKWLKRHYSPRR